MRLLGFLFCFLKGRAPRSELAKKFKQLLDGGKEIKTLQSFPYLVSSSRHPDSCISKHLFV